MKKYILIAGMVILACFFTACGTKEESPAESEESNLSESDQVFLNIKKDLTSDAQEIIDASQRTVYSSYEEVYNEYSQMLTDLYRAQEKDLKKEIADGNDNNALAKSVSVKVSNLQEIAEQGVSTTSKMAAINPTENSDYSQWSDKLNAIAIAYENKLTYLINEKK